MTKSLNTIETNIDLYTSKKFQLAATTPYMWTARGAEADKNICEGVKFEITPAPDTDGTSGPAPLVTVTIKAEKSGHYDFELDLVKASNGEITQTQPFAVFIP